MSNSQSLKQPLIDDISSNRTEASRAKSSLPNRNSLFSSATNPMPREGDISIDGSRRKREANPAVDNESNSDVGMHAGDCCLVFGEMILSSTLGGCTVS